MRIGHRPERDKRITTHVALVARAFGADRILVDRKDRELEKNFTGISERFGGDIVLETGTNWRNVIKDWIGQTVHLTMYGEELEVAMDEISREEDILVIVGAEKVPGEIYQMVRFNIAVGNQPHSEVAALAMFLDRYYDGKPLRRFKGKMNIVPSKHGKVVVEE